MAKKPALSDAVVTAALSLAAERGWRGLSLADIAGRAGIPLADLAEHFPSKAAILAAYAQGIDRHMLAGGVEAGESVRDRLFDVIMRRFDAMSADRAALKVILREAGDDPRTVLCGAGRFLESMALTLEAAGLPSSGLAGLGRIQGLAAIYLCTFRTFLNDDSADLARTMAALDKALRRAEDMAALLWRRRPRGEGTACARPAAAAMEKEA